ncbi:DUF465 domain-containing protein [Desulfovibrio sp. OttesenSCG-928-C14]|nr:DUF465 domain-containing protein [Desulfovibrio sp. OttesenSCG-928-C14]
MDQTELMLLEKYSTQDPELKQLWEEHQLFEKQLQKLEGKAYLTPTEDQQMREWKKQKLEGKTKMVAILDRYRKTEN